MIPEIEAKTLIQHVGKKSLHWFAVDYNMNIYRGCSHGCIYCDSRSECYRVPNFDQVTLKKNALTMLSKELLSKRKKGVLGIGSMSDPYNPYEKKLEITRQALQIVHDTNFGISIITKSHLITRDIDIFKKIQAKQSVIIKLTITCADDDMSKKIEPFASPSSKRFEALKQLSDAGLFCGILLMPILPFINDTNENIIQIVEKAAASGVKFIYGMFGVTLRDIQRDHFYKQLDTLFPGVSEQYKQYFGDQYSCSSPRYKELQRVYIETCKKHNILYKMSDIIKAYKKQETEPEQLSLF
ncbi:MAG: radical SAM protein [Coprobacillaceae bacterium]